MSSKEGEREFRIRPRRGRKPHDEPRAWSTAFKRILHYARMTSRRWKAHRSPLRAPFQQRCAVRLTYSANRTRGQWRAHGRYLSRESATHSESGRDQAFGSSGPVADVSAVLGKWQSAGDPRLFKLIISPEFGERCDLERLTQELLARMESDLGTSFEWVATAHYNTEHPHVHVALRGVTKDGQALRFERQYVRHGIRRHAENVVTRQLGYRTVLDAEDAERREVQTMRYTALDRILNRANTAGSGPTDTSESFAVDLNQFPRNTRQQHLRGRLLFLEQLELAQSNGSNQWLIRSDFETLLRGMQNATDRQRALAEHRALLSDARLPIRVTDLNRLEAPLEGRVLGHIEDETTGGATMILEGTDEKVHFIRHTAEIESARRQRKLQANAFIQIRPHSRRDGRGFSTIADLGSADELLTNSRYMRQKSQLLIQRGIVPVDNGWAGWLGRYERRLMETYQEIEQNPSRGQRRKDERPPDLGR